MTARPIRNPRERLVERVEAHLARGHTHLGAVFVVGAVSVVRRLFS